MKDPVICYVAVKGDVDPSRASFTRVPAVGEMVMLADGRLVAVTYGLHFASGMIDRDTEQIVAAAVVASPASDDVSSVFEIALRER